MQFGKLAAASFFISSFFHSPLLQARLAGSDGNLADYVIVGVGTAGAVLAKRLTDDMTTSVIALHSGENLTDDPLIKLSKNSAITVPSALIGAPIPFDISSLNLPPEVQELVQEFIDLSEESKNFLFETGATTPQVDADNREILWAIGKPGGGCSSINAGAWVRDTALNNELWEEVAGPEWSNDKMTQVYRELEEYGGKTNNPIYRGYHGPIHIHQAVATTFSKKFSQAVIDATGASLVLDYNDPKTPIGVSTQMQLSQRAKHGAFRVSSMTAFLNGSVMKKDGIGVKGRKLHVHFNSFALRTIWDGNKAVGVEYSQDGVTKSVFANKGVIVCGGLRSSTFLLHSGVGPASLLNSLSIPVIYDNPNVGQNLGDQPHVILLYVSNPDDSPLERNTFFQQISFLPDPIGNPIDRQIRLATATAIPGVNLALVDLCKPKSRGQITINSADPFQPPIIDSGMLTNSSDLDLYIRAFKIYIRNINLALTAIDPDYEMIFPDPAIINDDTLLTNFIRENIGSNHSYQSHCRMAPLDQGGVVDSSGRVYGVENLFVADDSIIPTSTDGCTMATAYLIAATIARLLGY